MLATAARSMTQPLPVRGLVLDVLLAVLSAYAAALLTSEVLASGPLSAPHGAAFGIAVLHGASVAARRVLPAVAVVALVLTASVYALVLGLPAYMLGPAVLVVAYGIAARLPRRQALPHVAALETALVVLVVLGPAPPGPDSVILYAALVAASAFLGSGVRGWQTLAAESARRAAELEEARLELARHAVAAERVRIARELHDAVAHSMSVIAMHAGAARLAVGRDSDAAREMLGVIERTSREALAEMRRLVTVLRDETAPASDGAGSATSGSRVPAPGLQDLHDLVARVAAAGLTVDVRSDEHFDHVPAGVSLAAYRVLQEALTNVVRHAGRTRARVSVSIQDDVVRLVVEDDGGHRPRQQRADGDGPPGHGTVGMRERVELYGGRLVAGPSPTGGWRVEALIPYAEVVA